MLPGPQEPTGDQLQNHLKIVVDDLLELYEHGIVVKTPEHPNGKSFGNSTFVSPDFISGIRVRVALVAIIADHPAMCKICGFADHRHNAAPCSKCTVSHEELFSKESLRNGSSLYSTVNA
jgi:hypothetical protein